MAMNFGIQVEEMADESAPPTSYGPSVKKGVQKRIESKRAPAHQPIGLMDFDAVEKGDQSKAPK